MPHISFRNNSSRTKPTSCFASHRNGKIGLKSRGMKRLGGAKYDESRDTLSTLQSSYWSANNSIRSMGIESHSLSSTRPNTIKSSRKSSFLLSSTVGWDRTDQPNPRFFGREDRETTLASNNWGFFVDVGVDKL